MKCGKEEHEKCVVYNTDNGRDCFRFPKVLLKCRKNNLDSCNECEWYKYLHKKEK
jgi:hypothetical protein